MGNWLRQRLLLLVLLVIQPLVSTANEPADVVNAFHSALVQAMKARTFNDRLAVVSPAVERHFQAHTIARISLGRNWRSLTEEQQVAYQVLLKALISSTYASRFDNFDGQVFTVHGTEPIGKKRMRVRSVLTTQSEAVTLDYQLQQQADNWLIYDVIANGVSDLSLKRSTYAALFDEGGLSAVETEIRENITRNQNPDLTTEPEEREEAAE